MDLNWVNLIALAIAVLLFIGYLLEQRGMPDDDDVDRVLDITVITDDFEEELDDDKYFEDEGEE